jgi:polyphosphate glucokinase
VSDVCDILYAALLPDEIVIGGGNVKNLKELPDHCRAGDNANAFEGGFRLWQKDWASAVPEYDDKPKK